MLTGVILTHNEESNILACIEHLRPHVEELILIDTESTDRTVALATPQVDKVLIHPHVPNFDAARNIAFPEASFDWLWFVDADEHVSVATGRLVRQVIAGQGEDFEALSIPFKSYFCGQWMQHCGWWPGYTMPRVLKRGHCRFSEQLHGGVEVNGRQARLPPEPALGIDHYSYRDVEHYVEKFNRYTSTEAGQMAGRGQRFDWREATAHMMHDLWHYYEANPGHRDGERGWILSWLSGQYRWLSHAKLIDIAERKEGSEGPISIPANLDEVLGVMRSELDRCRARRPRLPLGIVWRSPLWDPSGYADETRTFLMGLAAGPRSLRTEEIRWNDQTCQLPAHEAALLRALNRAERAPFTATITNCIPTLVAPDPRASLNILRTTFETDRIPDHWRPHLEQFDEIWVISRHNERAFRQSGVAPEKLRIVPSCVDTNRFRPDGPILELPTACRDRFVFLSVLDWQLRKGWDVLLRGYCRAFTPNSGAALLLKISRAHGYPLSVVREQADAVLKQLQTSLAERLDIVLWDESLAADQMAALYRSADAFVLPSRGEGWGRPYMEAMASGLPVIGTGASGNVDFMTQENCLLLPAQLVAVSEPAAREIPVFAGHLWYEPDEDALVEALQRLHVDGVFRQWLARRGAADVRNGFHLGVGAAQVERALALAEERLTTALLPAPRPDQIRVSLEGEFFANHSFANINERLVERFLADDSLAIAAERVQYQPVFDQEAPHAHRIRPALARAFAEGPQVTIRHAFPPNWQRPATGKWVHIQPWEYGHLPQDWLAPLRDEVDEIWAPSNYVKHVYVASGVPADKIHVIPWGADRTTFTPQAPPRHLPTKKAFRFLFVGGAIPRKGFDVLLAAYLAEFTRDDDVCLVVKDLGTKTFYRDSDGRGAIERAAEDPRSPEIVYFDESMTAGQLASLYTACQVLAAPYRGEGFGLPILEAMACGLPVIVPDGGPATDFVTPEAGYLVPAEEVPTDHDWQLCGPALEFSVRMGDVRRALRRAYDDRVDCRERGILAARRASSFTWERTAALMTRRLRDLVQPDLAKNGVSDRAPTRQASQESGSAKLAAVLLVQDDERQLADCLARVTPFVDEVIVGNRGSRDRSPQIAQEYGAKLLSVDGDNETAAERQCLTESTADWILRLSPDDQLDDQDADGWRSLIAIQPHCLEEMTLTCRTSGRAVSGKSHRKLRFVRRLALLNELPSELAAAAAVGE